MPQAFDPNELLAPTIPPAQGFDPNDLLEGNTKAAQEFFEADFDAETTASFGLRMSIARGDTLKEKQTRLQNRFPEGTLKVMPESLVLGFEDDTLVWRETERAQWKLIEPQGFDWADIPEAIAPSTEAIIGETAMAIGSGGASVPMTIARQAMGALGGELFEQAVQYITGTQEQSLQEVGGESLIEGGLSALGGAAMSPLAAGYNIVTGRGALRLSEEGIQTVKAAGEIDDELMAGLTPGMVSDNPTIALSEKQSAALLPGLRRRYRQLKKILDGAITGKVDPALRDKAMNRVLQSLDNLNKEFLRRVGNPRTTMSKGGDALRQGLEEYDQLARTQIKELYRAARSIEEPAFDMQQMLDISVGLELGAKGNVDSAVAAQIKLLRQISGPIDLPNGEIVSVTDQLRNIRTELFALKTVKPGEVANQANGQANDLYQAITQTLKTPTNENPVFQAAWKDASKAALDRFKTWEKAPIVAIARSQNPADLVKSYAKPHQSDNLLAIRNTVSTKQWNEFTNAFYADLLKDTGKAYKTFKAFDQETLDVLMPRSDQVIWSKATLDMQRITAIGAKDISEQQISNKNFIDTLIRGANRRTVQTIMRSANLGNNKAMRDSVRAAILEWAWDGIVKQGKTTLEVNAKTLANRVVTLKRTGFWRFMSTADKQIIGNAEIVARAFGQIADAGTSIQAAEAVSGLKGLKRSAIMTFVKNEMVAQFYLSSMGRKILIGSGLPNSNGAMLRLLGGALAETFPPEDISELQ